MVAIAVLKGDGILLLPGFLGSYFPLGREILDSLGESLE